MHLLIAGSSPFPRGQKLRIRRAPVPARSFSGDNHRVIFTDPSSSAAFAHTAIEAFANEVINDFIPDSFVYTFQKKDGQLEQLSKSDIERRIELDQKLHSVLPQGLSLASPKGTAVWQHYQEIKKMRNRIIHLKAVDRNRSGPEEEGLWGDMLRSYSVPYCDYAYAIIGHYNPAAENRRWFQRYRYNPN
jgi:hypothetical protein